MTDKDLWNAFILENGIRDKEYEAWAFGVEPDILAQLVVGEIKTATSSAYPLYEIESEPLPMIGEYSVILDSKSNAVCVIKTIDVKVIPFNEVTAEHAYKEGEGDRSLEYWITVHKKFFEDCLSEVGLVFTHDMKVVCEEFEVVYKI